MDELLGVYLKKNRESKKITLEDIAKETKIQKRYLEAIENDKYDEIPGETYLRGFLRNYSVSIGLNPEIIIEKYDNIKKKAEEEEIIVEEIKESKKKKKESNLLFNSVIAFLVLIVFFILVNFVGGIYSNIRKSDKDALKNENIKEVNLIQETVPLEEEKTEIKVAAITVAAVTTVEAVTNDIKNTATEAAIIEDKNAVTTVAATTSSKKEEKITTGKNIKIIASGQSWLEIKENDIIKFQGTINEGIIKEIKSSEKINIIIGDASNIKLELNGKDLGILGKPGEVIRKEF